jgi:diguanylate cyclase (GGDEF)-like protein
VFAILTIWSLICGRYLNDLRENLIDRNEQLQSIITKMSDTSERDQLTKTHNRHYVLENLAREKGRTDRSNQPFSICVFEIDDFDTLRSRSNPDAGDRVLKRFMKRVRTELRAMDSADALTDRLSLGRFSDDRYIVVLPQTGLYGAQRSAERIQRAVRAQPIGAGRPVTVSGGIAEYQRGESIPALIDRAEQALNEAALAGGDRIKGDEKRQVGSADIVQLHRSRPRFL